jgi:hypothetical protein
VIDLNVSKVFNQNHDAGELDEGAVELDASLVAREQLSPVAELCKKPFDEFRFPNHGVAPIPPPNV